MQPDELAALANWYHDAIAPKVVLLSAAEILSNRAVYKVSP